MIFAGFHVCAPKYITNGFYLTGDLFSLVLTAYVPVLILIQYSVEL